MPGQNLGQQVPYLCTLSTPGTRHLYLWPQAHPKPHNSDGNLWGDQRPESSGHGQNAHIHPSRSTLQGLADSLLQVGLNMKAFHPEPTDPRSDRAQEVTIPGTHRAPLGESGLPHTQTDSPGSRAL